jgi:hypothetical protein
VFGREGGGTEEVGGGGHAGHTTFMKPPTGVETWLLDRVLGGGEAAGVRDPLGKL